MNAKLRMFALLVLFALAGAALGDLKWPAVPARPKGTLFTARVPGGPWNIRSTWKGGVVPQNNGVVVIPSGSTVTLSGTPTASLRWVEVNGTLALSSTDNSTLSVDTLLIGVTGTFTLNSLDKGKTAQVIFTNNNSGLPSTDTQQVTRGLIGAGIVHIIGAPKTNMITVDTDLPTHSNSITLNAIPTNWQQYDYLVIAGTHFRRGQKMQDEKVQITGIDTFHNVITFSPLQYDHQRVATTDAQGHTIVPPLHIANLTRNVVFSSAASYPASYRGHVLIGNQNSDIENVRFVDLGRTDKTRPLDDYVVTTDGNGNPTKLIAQTGKITNIRGRYPLYVFNTSGNAPNNTKPPDFFPAPMTIQGCVVEGSIGWGFVNRRSNVNFIGNVAYNFIGAGFVAEGGDEVGSFQNNIAIHGSGQIAIDQPAQYQTNPTTDGADLNKYRKQRMNFRNPTRPQPIEDIAFNGEGFWFSGPALFVSGNVANSCHGTGMFWHTTGVVEVSSVFDAGHSAFGNYTYFPKTWVDQAYGAGFLSRLGYAPRNWSTGGGDLLAGDLPIRYCDTFTGYANFVGFRLRFTNQDNIAWYQDDGPASNQKAFYTPSYQSLVRGTVPTNRQYQVMNNLTLWNNEAAITLTYDGFTTWTNITGISRLDYDENKNPQNTYPDPGISPNDGLEANFIINDMTWTNLILDGYEQATSQWDGTTTDQPPTNVSFKDNPHQYFNYVQDGTFKKGLCSAPGMPIGSVDGSGNGTITWTPPVDYTPTGYLVRYRESGDQQWRFASLAGGVANPSVPVSVIPGKTYQVEVDAGCNKGTDPTTHLPLTGVSDWVEKTFNGACAPAAIAAQPADAMSIASGQMATFAVAASGDGPFSYQWYEGASGATDNPVGGDSNTLSIMPESATSYWVSVANSCGKTTSRAAMVTLCDPPAIAVSPQSQTITAGSSTLLSVTASGNGPFTYQWYVGDANSNPAPLGTDSTQSVAPLEMASFWVVVTNSCGNTLSDTAVVSVCNPPAIAVQPVSQTVPAGTSVTLDVGVNGYGPFTYQWYLGTAPDTSNPISTDDSPLTVTPASTTSYWVFITNDCGVAQSNTATVTVCNPPVITVQPQSQTITAGQSVTLSVTATGDAPLNYSWFSGLSPIGANSSTLTVAPTSTTSYWVDVSNSCGEADSPPATITVICNAPTIVQQPVSQTVNAGTSVTLSVAAGANGPFNFQWYQDGTPVGANSSTLTVTPSATANYWVSVSNVCTAVTSNTATVTVCGPAAITTQPASQTIASGTSATLTVTASGGGTFSYQWYEGTNGTTTTPVGTNSSTFISPQLTAAKSYWVRVTKVCNGTSTVDSATATISVQIQIVRRQIIGNNANSMPSVTTNWSQPTQAGSLLVAVISASDVASIGAFTPPAGWQLANTNSYSNIKTSIYYYPNNPGGRTSETFHLTNYPDSTLDLIEYTGVMATSPLDQIAIDEGTAPVGMVVVDTGTTPPTTKPREVVVTALTTYAQTSFTTPTNSFVKIDEQSVLYHLTTAVHESLVTSTGSYGHSANVGGNAQWVGLAVTFKAIDCSGPPTISSQPASQSIAAGQPVTLSVTAAGGSGFTYQWYQGSAPSTATPVGANASTLTVTPATTTSYWVNVSSPCGSTASNTATVSVCTPPSITAQPQSPTVNPGASATLTVTAGGNGPFTYQWYQGTSGTTTTPVGTNSGSFTVTPAATTSYWVRVTNACGPVSSNTATVTICTPPGIATQPASQSVSSGSSATLSVSASGSGPFSYQWYQGTSGTVTTPVGTNSSSFVTPALTATTSYWVRVTSACSPGTVNSATATITVLTHIARRQLAGNTANSMSTLTANWTQATQAGTLLVAVLSASDVNPIGAFTAPAGWQLANTYAFSNVKTSIYYYPNNPGGRSAETFTLTNFPDSTLTLIEYSGVMASSPLDKTGLDGNWNPVNGIVTSGSTASTAQSKEVVVTALTTYAQTSFTSPTNGFIKIDERGVLYHLTTAVHENIVTTAGSWGHSATAGGNAPWVGLVATFKSADTTP